MNPTIRDVAELAEVHPSTVSRVINGDSRISEKTKNKVLLIIKKVGYTPNAIARGLKTKRTYTLGMLIPDITNPFFAELARGVEDAANKNSFNVILCNTDDKLKKGKNLSGNINGSFYLESSEFNSLTLADEVRERGRALIKLINGVSKFNRNNFVDISEDGITRVEDDGKRYNYVFLEGKAKIRTKVRGQLTVIAADGSEKIVTQPSAFESLLEVAQKHNIIAEALSFYRDDTWISLYKAYEIIKDDVGGKHQIIKSGWSVNSEINRFTQTAQSRAALGDSARHASKKYKPPVQPMTLSEAKALIKTILSRWISSKT